MKWLSKRETFRAIKTQQSSIVDLRSSVEALEKQVYMMPDWRIAICGGTSPTIGDQLMELQRNFDLLCDHLGVEKQIDPERAHYEKVSKEVK